MAQRKAERCEERVRSDAEVGVDRFLVLGKRPYVLQKTAAHKRVKLRSPGRARLASSKCESGFTGVVDGCTTHDARRTREAGGDWVASGNVAAWVTQSGEARIGSVGRRG
jgi:hypothetical protein